MKDARPAIRLLGPPQIEGGPSGSHALERKAAGLLSYLALHGESARNRLAALLWPDAEADGARNSLRQALFKLRKAAGKDLIVGSAQLRIAPGVTVDVGESPPPDGQLLEGCEYADCPDFAQWLDAERIRVDRARVENAAARADELESAGRIDEALRLAADILRRMPLEEVGHRRLIRLHYLNGDRAAALAAYDRCAKELRAELDIEPSEETRALAAALETAPPSISRAARPIVPVTLSRPPHLIGRAEDLERLDQAWREERAFVVVGDPGLGKSRLLAEFIFDQSRILATAARPGDSGIPYAALARILRLALARLPALADGGWRSELSRVLPELGSAPAKSIRGERLVMERALTALIEAAIDAGITALVLDDLHFADEASVEMLHVLAGSERLVRLRWGFAQRPAEGGQATRALRDKLGESGALVEVELAPLGVAQMIALVDSLRIPGLEGAAVAEQLIRFTGGNPLYALETLKHMLAVGASPMQLREGRLPRPVNVGALIERRLKQLSPAAMSVARVAALAGVDFDAGLAARVLETNEIALADAWNELEAAQVLRGAAFAHDLVFEAMVRSVPVPIARQVHRRIAAYIEEHAGEPARIAEHWIAAEEAARAVPHLKVAAIRAEAAARFGDARALLERAVAIADGAGLKSMALDLQFLLVEPLKDIGASGEALAVIARMHANVTTVDERIRVAISEARVLTQLGRCTESEAVARSVLDDPDCMEDADPMRVAELRHALASNLLVARRIPEALELLALVETPLRSHPDLQYRGWFHSDFARALLLSDRLTLADQHLDAALEFSRQVGRQRMICGVLLIKGQVAAASGLISEPVERYHEAQRAIADLEPSVTTMVIHLLLAASLADGGRFREALASIEIALATSAESDRAWLGRARSLQTLVYSHLGQHHLAAQSEVEDERLPSAPMTIPARLVARIERAWSIEAPLDKLFEDANAIVANVGTPSVHWHLALLRALAQPGAFDADALAGLQRKASDGGLHGHAMAAQLASAVAARGRGDHAACVEHARAALRAMRRYTLPGSYRPRLWLICHEALRGIDSELARRALQEGVEWIHAVATFHVPDAFREGFLRRNPVNRSLLLAASASAGGR